MMCEKEQDQGQQQNIVLTEKSESGMLHCDEAMQQTAVEDS
jgi:hypothetical protein